MSRRATLSEPPLPLFIAPEAVDASALPPGRLPSYIRDHRQRLRARFLDGGAAAVPDYELLELILFGAIPRADVKPLARRLIDRFDGFAGVDHRAADAASAGRGRRRGGAGGAETGGSGGRCG